MAYVLDTNVVSDMRKFFAGEITDEKFRAWMEGHRPEDTYVASLSIWEIKRGILAKQVKDPKSCSKLEKWFEALREDYNARILPFCDKAALICAAYDASSRGLNADAMIAATAAANEMGVVTRNVKHFKNYDVPLVNPYGYD